MNESKFTEDTLIETEQAEPETKNPRIVKVLKLQDQIARQNELEKLRLGQMEQERAYIEKMNLSVEENLGNTREEQNYNREFEQNIKRQVYQLHGISDDKLQGMSEFRNAYYQGAAFALFFLSVMLTALCGLLHGFGTKICIFMAFYTAVEGALLTSGKRQMTLNGVMNRILYLLLFPAMMVIFVSYELKFEEYEFLVEVFTIAGMAVLIIGRISWFVYDPYRADRRNRKRADDAIREMEKEALKEVRIREKKMEKLERKRERAAEKAKKRQQKQNIRIEKRQIKAEERNVKKQKGNEKQETVETSGAKQQISVD